VKPRKLTLVPDLEVDKGPDSLGAFCEGKEAKDATTQILLAAAWLRDHRGRHDFTADEMYTCLRHQWSASPADLPQKLRDMKHSELLTSGDGRGRYQLHLMGEKKLKTIDTVS
jgi:hypothetical protein